MIEVRSHVQFNPPKPTFGQSKVSKSPDNGVGGKTIKQLNKRNSAVAKQH